MSYGFPLVTLGLVIVVVFLKIKIMRMGRQIDELRARINLLEYRHG